MLATERLGAQLLWVINRRQLSRPARRLLPSNRTPWRVRRCLLLNRHGAAGPSRGDDGRDGRLRRRRGAWLIPTRLWRTAPEQANASARQRRRSPRPVPTRARR
jgi:hypothetical protein